jgi:ribosomal protein S18 acetylase RimI-like enzyme
VKIIRRIRIGEADLFKQIRLTSLQDAPYAFSSNYDAALHRSAESWCEQADGTALGTDRATFIAFMDGIPVGIAAVYRIEGQVNVGEVLQVWVDPEHRGTSVARDLMDIVVKWAGENNFHKIIATVTGGNARAVKFYTQYGFSIMSQSSLPDSDGISLAKEIK